ncbi:MAG: hypothetical protein IT278_07945 [Ignavibacteriaceae bacterium]|jgi:hypothetical protein|nr:hypothetical protein [Ignavibacteriaceae bacterium]MCC6637643.1 hypothetical protein [Ignavibacteriaceae bacterium]
MLPDSHRCPSNLIPTNTFVKLILSLLNKGKFSKPVYDQPIKEFLYSLKTIKFLSIILVFCILPAKPQNSTITDNTFYLPRSLKSGEVTHNIGLSSTKLPEDVIETDDSFLSPLFTYRLKVGILDNLLAEGSFESNIVTFSFASGLKWNHNFGDIRLSVGTDVAFWFGRLKSYGFDTGIDGWNLSPNITLGYTFPNFSVSIKSEVMLILTQSTRNGDVHTLNTYRTMAGYSLAAYIEQPLWKKNFVVIGFKANYARFYYPLWAGFSTFDRFFFLPEFVFSFNL